MAMAARKRKAAPRRRRRSRPAKKARRRSSSKWGVRAKRAGAAAALGFVRGQTTALNTVMARLPAIAGTKTLSLGAALIVANDMLIKNKWVGMAGEAALIVGAWEAGRGGFKGEAPSGQSALQGGDDDDDISGSV